MIAIAENNRDRQTDQKFDLSTIEWNTSAINFGNGPVRRFLIDSQNSLIFFVEFCMRVCVFVTRSDCQNCTVSNVILVLSMELSRFECSTPNQMRMQWHWTRQTKTDIISSNKATKRISKWENREVIFSILCVLKRKKNGSLIRFCFCKSVLKVNRSAHFKNTSFHRKIANKNPKLLIEIKQ